MTEIGANGIKNYERIKSFDEPDIILKILKEYKITATIIIYTICFRFYERLAVLYNIYI